MAKLSHRLEPFRALMYDPQRCGDLALVICPPYDVIDPALQHDLYQRSPFNIIRLELGREQNRYHLASQTLTDWIKQGVLIKAPRPAFYLYTQRFELEGRLLVRNGLVTRIRLDFPGDAPILPHERTFAGPKQDRLRLLEATRVNLSSIFGIYRGESAEIDKIYARISKLPPLLALRDDQGIEHEIRVIDREDDIIAIQTSLRDRVILIADGHHRFETAKLYRKQRRLADGDPHTLKPYDYTMITLVSSEDPGLVVKSFNRIVRGVMGFNMSSFIENLGKWFNIEKLPWNENAERTLIELQAGTVGAAFNGAQEVFLMTLKRDVALDELMPQLPPPVRKLEVAVLHELILPQFFRAIKSELPPENGIDYTPSVPAALSAVRQSRACAAFLLPSPSIHDIEKVSESGATMPEKSTYFFPKLATGLVMNPLDE